MTMDATVRWDLPLLFAGQAQKEIYHNEAIARIDLLMHPRAESADLAEPPSTRAVGQCWIVATSAVGEWNDRGGHFACWTEGGWRFVAPRAGLTIEVADRGHKLRYDGVAWRDGEMRGEGLYIADKQVVGPRAEPIADPAGGGVVDAEGRAALAAILSALRAHGLIDI